MAGRMRPARSGVRAAADLRPSLRGRSRRQRCDRPGLAFADLDLQAGECAGSIASGPEAVGRSEPDRPPGAAHSQSGCVDETNPEWAGNDEIGLGGVGLDETGEVAKVHEFLIYDDFDDGDEKRYDPPLRFISFSLQEGANR